MKRFSNKKPYDVQLTYTEQKITALNDPDRSGSEGEEVSDESENEITE